MAQTSQAPSLLHRESRAPFLPLQAFTQTSRHESPALNADARDTGS